METTSIKYQGKVSIKLKIKNKTISISTYNSGTPALQKILCKFLCGYVNAGVGTPQTIQLRRTDDGWSSSHYITCLNQEIYLTGRRYLQDTYEIDGDNITGWIARLNAAIPYNTIMQTNIIDPDSEEAEGKTVQYRLYLVSNYDEEDVSERYHDLAYIDINYDDIYSITPGTQALIEWDMRVII